MKQGKVVAAFPGMGKTFVAAKYKNTADLDMGEYRWVYDGDPALPYEQRKAMRPFAQNPQWPQNYVDAVVLAKQTHDIVMVSFCPEIDYLIDCNFVPSKTAWSVLESRFRARNNPERFIEITKARFENNRGVGIEIADDEFLENALKRHKILEG